MRKIIYAFIFIFTLALPVFAEKIPIKITPVEVISTSHDEVEVGDKINFQVVDDVYVDGKLYIKKYSPIKGTVDFVQPNGWGGDSAEVKFCSFETHDADRKKVVISDTILIRGTTDKINNTKQIIQGINYFVDYLLVFLRGSEIFIEPDTRAYNVFIER